MDLVVASTLLGFAALFGQSKDLEVVSALMILATIGYVTGDGRWWSYLVAPLTMVLAGAVGSYLFKQSEPSPSGDW